MDIQVASNSGTVWNDAAVNIVVRVISVGDTPRCAIASPQGMCAGLPLVGTAKSFSKVIASIGVPHIV